MDPDTKRFPLETRRKSCDPKTTARSEPHSHLHCPPVGGQCCDQHHPRENFCMRALAFTMLITLSSGNSISDYNPETNDPTKPNIILMLADDMNWFDVSSYSKLYDYAPKNITTPNIDRIASEGTMFTSMFTATALCAPTRQQLYTGLFPVRNGAYPQHSVTDEGTRSIAHYFTDIGYRVGLIGKDHIGPRSVYPFEYLGEGTKGSDGESTFSLEQTEHFIARDRSQPFLLIIASHNPHGPHNRGDQSAFDADSLTVPAFLVDTPTTRKNLAKYLAEVIDLDNEVGAVDQILDTAKTKGNTIFIFTSEQGSNTGFAKGSLYDAGIKTAFIVRWPEQLKPAQSNDAIVQYVDVVPTLIDAAGGEVPTGLDGKSFLEVLEQGVKEHRDYAFGVHTSRNIRGSKDYPIRSIRSRHHKLILNLMPEKKFTPWGFPGDWRTFARNGDSWAAKRIESYRNRPMIEFYDLSDDPFELVNLANDPNQLALIDHLTGKLVAWMDSQGDKGVETELSACDHAASFKSCP